MGDRNQKKTLRMGADGLPNDDVSHFAANPEQLRRIEEVAEELHTFKVTPLLDHNDPHSHVLVGLLDGTSNDVDQDPLHASNVAKVREQIRDLKLQGFRIHEDYIAGPGTQIDRITNLTDNAIGHTSLERAEAMYWRLVDRAQPIFRADPDAKVSALLEGFSRGGSELPLVARMLHERGIPDTYRSVMVPDAQGNMIETFPHFHQPPGTIPIATLAYDPVPTGHLQMLDRRLPGSVVNGLQLNSTDVRSLFKVDVQVPQGFSPDGRFYSATLDMAHSDVGGTYLRGGLGVRTFNIATDYHNAIFGAPLLQRQHEPDDPRMNVIHRSREGNPIYRVLPTVDRALPEGQVARLAPDYWRVAPPGQVVSIPEQAPEPVDERFKPLLESAKPVARSPLAPEPKLPAAEALLERVMQDKNTTLLPYQPPVSKLAVGLFGAGVAATLYDIVQTGERANALSDQGNRLAAQSELTHFGARNVGGWAGSAAAGAMAGSWTGPGAIAFAAVGAISTSVAGEKIADWWDQRKIYHQIDRDGVDWRFNGRQWLRQQQADLTPDGVNAPQQQAFAALPDKANELNYRATLAAVDLAAREAPPPRDPYQLPATDADRPSLRPAPWTHDPQSGQWHRTVAVGLNRHNDQPIFEPETASAQRAAELEQLSAQIIAANIANGPAARAARVELAYRSNGWDAYGPMPANLQAALSDPDTLITSNGKQYQRSADGIWTHEDQHAEGNLKLELDTTREALQPALAQHAEAMAAVRPQPALSTLPQPERDRAELSTTYVSFGIDPHLKPETLDAVLLAVQRTREAHGIDPATTSLVPQPNAQGKYDITSSLAHLRVEANGAVQIAATTTTEDIERALGEVQGRGNGQTPMQAQTQAQAPTQAAPTPTTETQTVAAPQDTTVVAAQQAALQQTLQAQQHQAEREREQSTEQTATTPGVSTEQTPQLNNPTAPTHSTPTSAPQASTPAIPAHLQDFRHPEHPEHWSYTHALDKVHAMEAKAGIASGPHSEQLAASLTEQMSVQVFEKTPSWPVSQITDLARVELRDKDVVAIEDKPSVDKDPPREIRLPTQQALARSVEEISADWSKQQMPHLHQPQAAVTEAPTEAIDPRSLPAHDWRHPEHPGHGLYQDVRGKIADAYTQANVGITDAQLERTTAAVAVDMQRQHVTQATHVYLMENPQGVVGPGSGIGVRQGSDLTHPSSETPAAVVAQAPGSDQNFQLAAQIAVQQAYEQQAY